MSIDLDELAKLVRALRDSGVSHFKGTVPPDHRHMVELGLRPLSSPPSAPPEKAEEVAAEKPDAVAAAEKRLFGG